MLHMRDICILVLALVHCALAVQVGVAGNTHWKISGESRPVQVAGCDGAAPKTALALFPGTAASFSFFGSSVKLLGVSIPQGADALVSIDGGGPFRVDSASTAASCTSFVQLSTNDTTKLHTLHVSVLDEPKTALNLILGLIPWLQQDQSVFTVLALDITSPSAPTLPARPSTESTTKPPPQTGPPGTPPPQACSTIDPTKAPEVTSSSDPPNPNSSPLQTGTSDTAAPDPSGGAENGHGVSSSSTTISDSQLPSNEPYTITATDSHPDVPGPTAAASNQDSTEQVEAASARGGTKVSTIVPAVLVPLASVGILLGALWFLRNQRRRRIPPSTAFRMANPEYTSPTSPYMYAPGARWEMGQVRDRNGVWTPFYEEQR